MSGFQGVRGLLCVVIAAAALATGCQSKDAEKEVSPDTVVDVVVVQPEPLALHQELPGRIEPLRVAEVRARVAGVVLRRRFEEGSQVKAGQVLFQIDPLPLKAALSRAQGELARAQASLFNAQAVFKRYEPLVKMNAISGQDFDAAEAALKSALADRQSAQAQVETARLNLGYATVTAPISGRIGQALVTEGALVGQNEATPLALIQQLDPVYVDFRQPVTEALRLRQALSEGRLASTDGDGEGKGARIAVTLAGTDQRREGHLLFSDITVDRDTGQLLLRGRIPNPDGLLLPGMYVRVHTRLGTEPEALLVPQRAVRRGPGAEATVLVVDGAGVVQTRDIETGAMHGARWHVVTGLSPGERVVVGGQAQPGAQVKVRTASQDTALAEPATGKARHP